MEINVKNVKINQAFSEETLCFTADVFVNGKKTAHAKNDGRGGCTWYHAYPNMHEVLKQAETHAKSLPSHKEKIGDKEISIDMNLELVIDELIYAISNKKEFEKHEKKLNKLMETNICYGRPDKSSYSYVGFKGNPKISDLAKTEKGKVAIANLIEYVKPKMKAWEIIYNTNI